MGVLCGTHSQNSMTEEVVFGLMVWLMEEFLLRYSTQFSKVGVRGKGAAESQKRQQTGSGGTLEEPWGNPGGTREHLCQSLAIQNHY